MTSITPRLTITSTPATNRGVRVEAFLRVGEVVMPALAAGTTASAAVIVGTRAVTPVAQWLGGMPLETPEALTAGLATAGVAVFTHYTLQLLRSSRAAVAALMPSAKMEPGLGTRAQTAIADHRTQRQATFDTMRAGALMTVPFLSVALAGGEWGPLCAGGAAISGSTALAQWLSTAFWDSTYAIHARDVRAQIEAKSAKSDEA